MSKLDNIKHAVKIAEMAEVPVMFSRYESRYMIDMIEIQKDALIDIHDYCLHCVEKGGEPATAIFYVMNKIMKTSKRIKELEDEKTNRTPVDN